MQLPALQLPPDRCTTALRWKEVSRLPRTVSTFGAHVEETGAAPCSSGHPWHSALGTAGKQRAERKDRAHCHARNLNPVI